ncbi:conserved hypothetical protein [Hydrogenobacter thermophilus TK-6]|uniref:DNA polymerase III delta prime subunit n=1 Tax=Hydrogenobacter thermophilus (strain DSM 6534 / IAM 12695 / TK-6) TaxID=608538 RepID=D3DKB3_HYDTT|nr:DNA polymerase III subunit [Hydrogenobacter thermophilus]ADO46185.1 conserved hypothetical protein [Hydrogenobacter thermophilus TK-6]BAI70265.1 DNA polymerase III delta prime subunit [Hydrogenobacter thermophilus TK-6]
MHHKAKKLLESMYKLGRVPSSLLFFGKEGVGKKTVAFDFAKALLCMKRTFPACNDCPSCFHMNEFSKKPVEELRVYSDTSTGRKVFLYLQGDHPDFIYLQPEKDEIKIDQIRGVIDFVNLRPALSPKKVVLVWPAEAMNPYSQNALLKTLEEPPEDTHFILVCNMLDRILPTIRSRSYTVEFEELSEEDIKKLTGIEDRVILSLSEGSITKAKELSQKSHIIDMAKKVLSGSVLDVYKLSTQLENLSYEDQKLFLHTLEAMLHKKMLENKENYEIYERLIDRTVLVSDNLKRGLKLSLFVFYLKILLSEVV